MLDFWNCSNCRMAARHPDKYSTSCIAGATSTGQQGWMGMDGWGGHRGNSSVEHLFLLTMASGGRRLPCASRGGDSSYMMLGASLALVSWWDMWRPRSLSTSQSSTVAQPWPYLQVLSESTSCLGLPRGRLGETACIRTFHRYLQDLQTAGAVESVTASASGRR